MGIGNYRILNFIIGLWVYIGILDSKFRHIGFSAASLGTGMLVEYCIFSLQQEA